MILTHPIPVPEERHIRYLEQQGVAVCAPAVADIPQLAYKLLTHSARLVEMKRRIRELARPEAAHAIAQLARAMFERSEEHTSELQSLAYLVCRLLLEKKKRKLHILATGRRTTTITTLIHSPSECVLAPHRHSPIGPRAEHLRPSCIDGSPRGPTDPA